MLTFSMKYPPLAYVREQFFRFTCRTRRTCHPVFPSFFHQIAHNYVLFLFSSRNIIFWGESFFELSVENVAIDYVLGHRRRGCYMYVPLAAFDETTR